MALAPGSHKEQNVASGVASGLNNDHTHQVQQDKKRGSVLTTQEEPSIAGSDDKKKAAKESHCEWDEITCDELGNPVRICLVTRIWQEAILSKLVC